jgi:hypothetical protein
MSSSEIKDFKQKEKNLFDYVLKHEKTYFKDLINPPKPRHDPYKFKIKPYSFKYSF